MSGCSVRRNQWLGWVAMPVFEWGPWGLHGVLQGKAPVSLVPHCWSHWYHPKTSLLPPKCLARVLHWNVVQKCDLQVWELNVPLNCSVNPSPVCVGARWAALIVIWNGIQGLTSAFPEWVWLSYDGTGGGSFAMDAQAGWGGRKGGFGMAFPLRQWADPLVPLQLAHLRNQLSQWGFLLLLSN